MKKARLNLVNRQLVAAMSHPTRVHAMTVLSDREASPKELAAELGEPINNVTYHVNQLIDLDCIELVRTAPARGGRVVEHFYRASRDTWIDDDEWSALGPAERSVLTATLMREISADINEAIAAGTFFDPDDNHLSRTPIVVDAEGWSEVKGLLIETLSGLLDIRANVADRIGRDKAEDVFSTKVEILHFRSPSKSPSE